MVKIEYENSFVDSVWIMGKLLYLNLTRPGISYSVQQLSQFMSAPRKPHLQVAIHVIKYLAGIMNWGLYYPSES